jgi:cation diffusion facilitator family transporter
MSKQNNQVDSAKSKATKISIFTATSLAIIKSVIGLMVGSLAIVASAADSILDIISSSLNYYAIKKSEEPPDVDHPFGHGKFESLATFLQSFIILISGLYILYKAYVKLTTPHIMYQVDLGIYVMLFSIVVTFFLSRYLKSVAKKENSQILKADAMHYEIDLLTNAVVLISLIVIKFTGLVFIDAILSLIIAVYIIFEAIKLSYEVSKDLLDTELPKEDVEKIKNILDEFEEFHVDYHNLRTRRAGPKKFMDMHLTLCKNMSLMDAHNIADKIEDKLKESIKDIDVIIHLDPCDVRNCEHDKPCPPNRISIRTD